MFSLIKSIIWIAGILTVAYFVMGYFGYEVNKNYFIMSKAKCQEQLKECTDKLIHEGTDNARCDFNCTNPSLIIKKK